MWTSRKPPFEWVFFPPISLHLEGYRSNQQITALKLSRHRTSFQFGPSFPSLVAPSLNFDMFSIVCEPNPFSVLPPLIFSACMLRGIQRWEQWLEIRKGDGIGDYEGQQKIKCRWVKRILFNISETWTDELMEAIEVVRLPALGGSAGSHGWGARLGRRQKRVKEQK